MEFNVVADYSDDAFTNIYGFNRWVKLLKLILLTVPVDRIENNLRRHSRQTGRPF
jgi:hypothetical protein